MTSNGRVHMVSGHLFRVTALLATWCLFGAALHAQDPDVLLDAYGEVRDDAFDYLRVPLADQDRVYSSIQGRSIKELLNEVVAISRQSRADGNRYWGRIAGTKYETMTADWVQEKFRALGLEDVHRVPLDIPPQWMPQDWDLKAEGSGGTLSFSSAYPAVPFDPNRRLSREQWATFPSPMPTPLEVEAVWVGLGTEPDFAGRDVRGKAVVFQAMLAPGQMGNSAAFEGVGPRAEAAGAAMTIGIWGYYGNMAVVQSAQAQQTPGFWIGFEDGKRLRDLISEGPVTISASMDVDIVEGLTTPIQFGMLPGTTDETIIVTAHMDGWFDAALDNASGLAVMVTLAEHFSQIPREQRRRNMIFVGGAGHHPGSPGSPYMRESGMAENAALLLNAEHVAPAQFLRYGTELVRTAGISPRRWWVRGSDALLDITLNAYRTFGVNTVGPMHGRYGREPGSPAAAIRTDLARINEAAPGVQLIRSPDHKHTDLDIPALVPSVGLEAVTRAYAKIIDGVNTLSLAELQPTSKAVSQ